MEDIIKFVFSSVDASKKPHEALVDIGVITPEEIDRMKTMLLSPGGKSLMRFMILVNDRQPPREERTTDAYARFPAELEAFVKNCDNYAKTQSEQKALAEDSKEGRKKKRSAKKAK